MVLSAPYLTLCSAIFAGVSNAAYSVSKTYDHSNFWDEFEFRSSAEYLVDQYVGDNDPTHGVVDYVAQDVAFSKGLASINSNDQVELRVDTTDTVSIVTGRGAVRLESKDTFTQGLLVADVAHMPATSCGTWPAFWTYNFAEDPNGEVDILEGTVEMTQVENSVALHTCGTCSFPELTRPKCDLCGGDDGSGCGSSGPTGSYGTALNSQGGGVYATLYADDGLKLWFFPRNQIPSDLASGGDVDPTGWPAPYLTFKNGSNCDTTTFFKKQTIIINTTFCGSNIYDWSQQSNGQCEPKRAKTAAEEAALQDRESRTDETKWTADQATCAFYVASNGADYQDAFWQINYVRLYKSK